MARLGITTQAFAKMTPLEFQYALEAKKQALEAQQRDKYERMRMMLTHMWNMQGRVLKQKINNPKQVMRFPWDDESLLKPQPKQTQEQIKQAVLNIAKIFGGKKK